MKRLTDEEIRIAAQALADNPHISLDSIQETERHYDRVLGLVEAHPRNTYLIDEWYIWQKAAYLKARLLSV